MWVNSARGEGREHGRCECTKHFNARAQLFIRLFCLFRPVRASFYMVLGGAFPLHVKGFHTFNTLSEMHSSARPRDPPDVHAATNVLKCCSGNAHKPSDSPKTFMK